MPAKSGSKAKSKPKTKTAQMPARTEREPASKQPAGAVALAPAEFIINRRWSKPVESRVGARVRVELPENQIKGLAWQLLKLPQGVSLEQSEVQPIERDTTGPSHALVTQNRVFQFALDEAGDYTLQFNLARPFGQSGYADTFRLRVKAGN
jgi:hypothetical protein